MGFRNTEVKKRNHCHGSVCLYVTALETFLPKNLKFDMVLGQVAQSAYSETLCPKISKLDMVMGHIGLHRTQYKSFKNLYPGKVYTFIVSIIK